MRAPTSNITKFFRLPPDVWSAVSRYRYLNEHPTQVAAVTELLLAGLEAKAAAQKQAGGEREEAPRMAAAR